MSSFFHYFALAVPLYILVLIGFGLVRWGGWSKSVSAALSRFVFSIALPALLFHMMSGFSKLPPVDARLLVAFFGGCLIVFFLGVGICVLVAAAFYFTLFVTINLANKAILNPAFAASHRNVSI